MKKIILGLFFITGILSYSYEPAYMIFYKARLSNRDHFSSNGERLKTVGQIIRQDRANFHKYGIRDSEDEFESDFYDSNNRQLLENWINKENIPSKIKEKIVNENVLIYVDRNSKDDISIRIYDNSSDSEPIYTINAKSPENSKEFIRAIYFKDNEKVPFTGIDTRDGGISETSYKNGFLDGVTKTYYGSGKLKSEVYYKMNEGFKKFYSESGKLEREAYYINDELDGIEREYDENGQLKVERNYKDGIIHGISKSYYENGQLKNEINYEEPTSINGISKVYYENGQPKGEINFEKDPPTLKEYDKDGKIIFEGELNYEKLEEYGIALE